MLEDKVVTPDPAAVVTETVTAPVVVTPEKVVTPEPVVAKVVTPDPAVVTPDPAKVVTPDPATPVWPEQGMPTDWRERMLVGIDDPEGKALARLKRYASPAEAARGIEEHDRKVTELTERMKGLVKVPGKDAKPEEVAEFRKNMGVPEKPEEYKMFRPEGAKETPEIKALETEFAGVVHKAGLNQGQLDEVMQGYYAMEAKAAQAMDLRATAAAQQTQKALMAEMGADYEANMEITTRALNHYMGTNMRPFLDLQLIDGTRVGDHPDVVRGLVRVAKDWEGGAEMIDGKPAEGMDLEAEKASMLAKMGTKEYESDGFQQRLKSILGAINRRNGMKM